MTIYIGADHAGYELKQHLVGFLQGLGHQVVDCGNTEYDADDDYPRYIIPTAEKVAADKGSKGIVIGGSGQGEAIAANKVKGIHAAVFYGPMLPIGSVDVTGRQSEDPFEFIRLSRTHNDANVLSLGARFLTNEVAEKAVQEWLGTEFSGQDRYQRRIDMVEEMTA